MRLYSTSLYTTAKFSSLFIWKIILASSFCSNSSSQSQSALELKDIKLVDPWTPEAINAFGIEKDLCLRDPVVIAGDLSNSARVLGLMLLLPRYLLTNFSFFSKITLVSDPVDWNDHHRVDNKYNFQMLFFQLKFFVWIVES